MRVTRCLLFDIGCSSVDVYRCSLFVGHCLLYVVGSCLLIVVGWCVLVHLLCLFTLLCLVCPRLSISVCGFVACCWSLRALVVRSLLTFGGRCASLLLRVVCR